MPTTSLQLHGCPRCRGDMHATSDMYGPYQHCLHCGNVIYPPSQSAMTLLEALEDARKAMRKPVVGRPKKVRTA